MVAIGCFANESSLSDATSESFPDVKRLLLCVEARHIGERATHQSTGGATFCRLINAQKGDVILRLQSLDLDEVEEVAGGSIDFVGEQSIKFQAVFLGVSDQFAEGLPLV